MKHHNKGNILFRLFLLVIILLPTGSFAQKRVLVNIDRSKLSIFNNTTEMWRLLGDVIIRHNDVVMMCDSAYNFTKENMVEAYGNVHIIKSDTVNLYCQRANYNSLTRLAHVRNNVKLTDPKITLTTDSMIYDMATSIAYYDCGGKIVDKGKASTLTSQIGRYFTQRDLFYFNKNVVLKNKEYTLKADSLKYNTLTGKAFITGPTHIYGPNGTMYSESGWFNTKTNISEFSKNASITKGDQELKADTIDFNKLTGIGKARGAISITNKKERYTIKGNKGFYDDKNRRAHVSDKALFIQYSEKDTLYLHADTLYAQENPITRERIIKAWYGVRFFKPDLQGKCDSLIYFSKDSIMRMYKSPVLWSADSQLSANEIEMLPSGPNQSLVKMYQNSFMISREDTIGYNQIKGRNMIGHILKRELYKVDVNGNSQAVYYVSEEDAKKKQKKSVVGLNHVECTDIDIRLKQSKIHKVTFKTKPDCRLVPLDKIAEQDKELPGFKWLGLLRPKDKDDVLRDIK
ncbi:MAG: OstA-like protein [Bacteroidota bacterium]|nr:OstA-like protein [Bacteroidota bacterium]